MPRHLHPAIGLATTVVVAIAAVFAGMQFASPSSAPVGNTTTEAGARQDVVTEDIAIIAPIAIDGLVVNGPTAPDAFDVSVATGVGTIVPPGSWVDGTLPAEVPERIAFLDEAGPEADEVGDTTGTPPSGTPIADGHGGGAGDPCSPEPGSGAAPESCPDGLHSAVFADMTPEDIDLWLVPGVPMPGGGEYTVCSELAPGDGEIGLNAGTNLPATVTVRYWPASDASDVQTLTLPGVASQVAAWQAEIDATGTYTRGHYLFQHCGILTHLAPNTDYVMSGFAIDTYGRISEPVERHFNSAGAPTIPQMFAEPLGQTLLYVGVPFKSADGIPLLQAWVIDGADAPDCSDIPPGAVFLREVGSQHPIPVSAAYLRRHNYLGSYRSRVVDIYEVPEGSTVAICAQWLDQDAPSWAMGTIAQQQILVVQSPDTIRPVVTLTDLNLARGVDAGSVHVQTSGQFGWVCGDAYAPSEVASSGLTTVNERICDFADGSVSARAPGSAWSNLVLNTTVTLGSDTLTTRNMVRLGRYACVGMCELPPSLDYTVTLPLVTVGAGMCGSSSGDCTPPTRQTSLGTMSVRVDWEQGNTNGLDSWAIGDVDHALPDTVPLGALLPDAPRFDEDQYWTASVSADGWSGSAATVIRTDRQVTYTISVAGDCFVSDPPLPLTGTTSPGTGAVQKAVVRFDGLCPGAFYTATMELVDDAGHRAAASYPYTPGSAVWAGANFTVPHVTYQITGTMRVDTVPSWGLPWWLVGTSVYVGSREADRMASTVGGNLASCYAGTVHHADGLLTNVWVAQARTIHVRAYTRAVTEGMYGGVNMDATCGWRNQNQFVADDDYDIALADLIRGVTLTGDLWREGRSVALEPTSKIRYTITLQATRVEG